MTKEDSPVFIDTDCISSFLWVNDINVLEALYGGRIIIPEPVYSELSKPRVPHLKERTDDLIDKGSAYIGEIEFGSESHELYLSLLKGEKGQVRIGRGEASGIALAKVNNGILASNNFKDVSYYVKKYGLEHTSTPDILVEALKEKIITETEGDEIWAKMLAKKESYQRQHFQTI